MKKTAKERGQITPEVYQEALIRSGGRCERCGWYPEHRWAESMSGGARWRLEGAHAERRHTFGQEGVTADDVIMLCGPQVNSGTCHHWADHTREGRDWMLEYREKRIQERVRRLAEREGEENRGQSGGNADLSGPGLPSSIHIID